MEKRTAFIITTTLIALNLFFLLGLNDITGYSVADRAASAFTGNALAALAPILILSASLAIGIITLHELKQK